LNPIGLLECLVPRLLVFYHFFHPDDVASARQYSDFAEEQTRRGWDVTVVSGNRAWSDPSLRFPSREVWRGVKIRRLFRPAWPQSRAFPRLGNSAFLLAAWTLESLRLSAADAIVIGSDPAFAALLAIPLRATRPRTPILHWCFDLYPEAIEAESPSAMGFSGSLAPAARRLMALAYRRCDVLVDIGSVMRVRLGAYGADTRQETLVPWALAEPAAPIPPDPAVRAVLFRDGKLGVLYAGTMGKAHDFELILRLARACRARSGRTISFCFASRGNRTAELRAAVGPEDDNITFAPFAAETEIPARLAAADLHLVTLRPEWAGIVVPSKFFASLAMGRPVIYAGPGASEIAGWVRDLDVGFILEGPADIASGVERLHELVADPEALRRWQETARAAYVDRFSRRIVNDRWDALLRETIVRRAGILH
jgi:colanic acid biosynthesis glycosyl transferase WcaI